MAGWEEGVSPGPGHAVDLGGKLFLVFRLFPDFLHVFVSIQFFLLFLFLVLNILLFLLG